jgi:undecaprenyl-diphosphatase
MTLFEIIILALIQGLTEFLPVSSSAHLILPSELLGWQNQGLAFDVAVHVGSLFAVILFFRKEIVTLTAAWFSHGFSKKQSADSKLAWFIAIGTLPGIFFGFLMKDWIELNARSMTIIAITTLVFGVLLWFADKYGKQTRGLDKLTLKSVLLIGVAQAIAIIPGTSRSGITMTAGLFVGLDRESAARFSFLLSIPIILGAGLFSAIELSHSISEVDLRALGYGALFSFLSAYACIALFLKWIAKLGMLPFVIYRLLLGLILLLVVYL